MTLRLSRQPLAWFPVAMSAGALLAIAYHLVRFGTAPQPDEGAAAHIWQLLMAGQVPMIVIFAVKWLPEAPRAAAQILAVQLGAALAAAAPVFLLGW